MYSEGLTQSQTGYTAASRDPDDNDYNELWLNDDSRHPNHDTMGSIYPLTDSEGYRFPEYKKVLESNMNPQSNELWNNADENGFYENSRKKSFAHLCYAIGVIFVLNGIEIVLEFIRSGYVPYFAPAYLCWMLIAIFFHPKVRNMKEVGRSKFYDFISMMGLLGSCILELWERNDRMDTANQWIMVIYAIVYNFCVALLIRPRLNLAGFFSIGTSLTVLLFSANEIDNLVDLVHLMGWLFISSILFLIASGNISKSDRLCYLGFVENWRLRMQLASSLEQRKKVVSNEMTNKTAITSVFSQNENEGPLDANGLAALQNVVKFFKKEDLVDDGVIGKGQYGKVVRAFHQGQPVAYKKFYRNTNELSGEACRMFRDEVIALSRMRHPNIVMIMGAIVEENFLAIVMRLYSNNSVYDFLRNLDRVLEPEVRLKMIGHCILGVVFLHNCRVPAQGQNSEKSSTVYENRIHGDIKSPNFLVDENNGVALSDFGLSLMDSTREQRGLPFSPQWTAPEIFMGGRRTTASDIYALATVIWELLAQEIPYANIDSQALPMTVTQGGLRPVVPGNTPPKLASTLRQCWSAEPSKRPTAGDLWNVIKELKDPECNDNTMKLMKELGPRELERKIIDRSQLYDMVNIGEGYFCDVYKAIYHGTPVAVKVFEFGSHKKIAEVFRSEVSVLSRLTHPNVLMFLGICINKDSQMLITDYMEKGSLWDVMYGKHGQPVPPKRLTWSQRTKFAMEICRGMTYLHSMNIVHRDLKSANVLVDKNGSCCVADFGLTRTKAEQSIKMTICGTSEYTAPEVLHGGYNEKVDNYSFGIILCEMLTQMKPYAKYRHDNPVERKDIPRLTSGYMVEGNQVLRPELPIATPIPNIPGVPKVPPIPIPVGNSITPKRTSYFYYEGHQFMRNWESFGEDADAFIPRPHKHDISDIQTRKRNPVVRKKGLRKKKLAAPAPMSVIEQQTVEEVDDDDDSSVPSNSEKNKAVESQDQQETEQQQQEEEESQKTQKTQKHAEPNNENTNNETKVKGKVQEEPEEPENEPPSTSTSTQQLEHSNQSSPTPIEDSNSNSNGSSLRFDKFSSSKTESSKTESSNSEFDTQQQPQQQPQYQRQEDSIYSFEKLSEDITVTHWLYRAYSEVTRKCWETEASMRPLFVDIIPLMEKLNNICKKKKILVRDLKTMPELWVSIELRNNAAKRDQKKLTKDGWSFDQVRTIAQIQGVIVFSDYASSTTKEDNSEYHFPNLDTPSENISPNEMQHTSMQRIVMAMALQGQFLSHCFILSSMLLKRAISISSVSITPNNWRWMVLTAHCIAHILFKGHPIDDAHLLAAWKIAKPDLTKSMLKQVIDEAIGHFMKFTDYKIIFPSKSFKNFVREFSDLTQTNGSTKAEIRKIPHFSTKQYRAIRDHSAEFAKKHLNASNSAAINGTTTPTGPPTNHKPITPTRLAAEMKRKEFIQHPNLVDTGFNNEETVPNQRKQQNLQANPQTHQNQVREQVREQRQKQQQQQQQHQQRQKQSTLSQLQSQSSDKSSGGVSESDMSGGNEKLQDMMDGQCYPMSEEQRQRISQMEQELQLLEQQQEQQKQRQQLKRQKQKHWQKQMHSQKHREMVFSEDNLVTSNNERTNTQNQEITAEQFYSNPQNGESFYEQNQQIPQQQRILKQEQQQQQQHSPIPTMMHSGISNNSIQGRNPYSNSVLMYRSGGEAALGGNLQMPMKRKLVEKDISYSPNPNIRAMSRSPLSHSQNKNNFLARDSPSDNRSPLSRTRPLSKSPGALLHRPIDVRNGRKLENHHKMLRATKLKRRTSSRSGINRERSNSRSTSTSIHTRSSNSRSASNHLSPEVSTGSIHGSIPSPNISQHDSLMETNRIRNTNTNTGDSTGSRKKRNKKLEMKKEQIHQQKQQQQKQKQRTQNDSSSSSSSEGEFIARARPKNYTGSRRQKRDLVSIIRSSSRGETRKSKSEALKLQAQTEIRNRRNVRTSNGRTSGKDIAHSKSGSDPVRTPNHSQSIPEHPRVASN